MDNSIDLDAERIRSTLRDLSPDGDIPRSTMDAAARLAKREPKHPAIVELTRVLNSRDSF